jgi:hypothetical protein
MGVAKCEYKLDLKKLKTSKRLKKGTRKKIKELYNSSDSLKLDQLIENLRAYDVLKMIRQGALVGPQKKEIYSYIISEAKKTNWGDPDSKLGTEEWRKKQSEAMKALWEDEEYRKKQSEAIKAVWEDEELRKKQSEAMKAVWEDEELRKKQSEAMKAVWEDEEYRKKQSEAIKAVWEDEELRKKQSEGMKAVWEVRKYIPVLNAIVVYKCVQQEENMEMNLEVLADLLAYDFRGNYKISVRKRVLGEFESFNEIYTKLISS